MFDNTFTCSSALRRRPPTRRRGLLLPFSVLLLFTLSVGAATVHAVPSHAVIFMYHRFGEERFPTTNIRLDQFDAHLKHLENNGYSVWALDRIVSHLRAGKAIPDRTVAITIDDAFQSVYRHAYPRLKARGWPFTVFVATDPIDQKFPTMMRWEQMREMSNHGALFANHGTTHSHLVARKAGESDSAWRTRVKGEITRAEKRLETELGKAPKLFAYPFGEYDLQLAHLLEELGYTGFGQHSGPAGPYSDLRSLPRFPMAEAYGKINDFSMKAATLPLPVIEAVPRDPVISGQKRPTLEITLGEDDVRYGLLACYVSGQGRTEIVWKNGEKRRFTLQAAKPLPKGRSRYNCTAPSKLSGRFYWYSHPWLLISAP